MNSQVQRTRQQQQQLQTHHHATRKTTITYVGKNNNESRIRTLNIARTSNAQQARQSAGMLKSSTPNKMICNGNNSSLVKSAFQRNINDCFNALMKLNEQHAYAKINLKTEYNAKLEQLQRDHDRQVEEIKKKCITDAGF